MLRDKHALIENGEDILDVQKLYHVLKNWYEGLWRLERVDVNAKRVDEVCWRFCGLEL